MTRQEVIKFVMKSVKAQFSGEGVCPFPFVIGRFGIGKSSMLCQISQELQKKPVFVIVSAIDPSLQHFPTLETDGERKKLSYLSWEGWFNSDYLIVLDEFDKIHPNNATFLLPVLSVRRIGEQTVKAGIVLLGNSSDILYRVPALQSRLQIVTLDDPQKTEVLSYLSSRYFHYLKSDENFRHVFSLISEFVDRVGFSEELTPRQIDALLSYATQGVMELWEFQPFLPSVFPKFSTFVNEVVNFPSPHAQQTEIVNFLKLSTTSAHFYFVRLFVSHIFTCPEHHPFTLKDFLKTLKKNSPHLLDCAVSAVVSFQQNENYFDVISTIADDPELSRIIPSVVREQI